MITYTTGDIFTSDADVLVNPTNCRAVMGAGLALQFARNFPGIELWYKGIQKSSGLMPGDLYIYSDNPSVLCFPTKDHWKQESKLSYIYEGLENLLGVVDLAHNDPESYGLFFFETIAFPRLGCGLGGLQWEEVKPVMEQYLDNPMFDTYIYE